jgi:hypothetical protein
LFYIYECLGIVVCVSHPASWLNILLDIRGTAGL